jgi:hypothetical protein
MYRWYYAYSPFAAAPNPRGEGYSRHTPRLVFLKAPIQKPLNGSLAYAAFKAFLFAEPPARHLGSSNILPSLMAATSADLANLPRRRIHSACSMAESPAVLQPLPMPLRIAHHTLRFAYEEWP